MGQYYRPILTDMHGRERVYNRNVAGKYTTAKLTEHSWWRNVFVSTICNKLLYNPMRVVWVGDYADDAGPTNGIQGNELKRIHKKAWDSKGNDVKEDKRYLDGYYLVNHTKQTYIDCDEYKKESIDRYGWCMHPLPLLTAIGNGLGGGDYDGINMQYIGSWANDLISIEDAAPDGYTEMHCAFRED